MRSEERAARKMEPAAPQSASAATAPAHPLAGTEWRLVEFQSMDEAVGTARPNDPSLYTMRLSADGTVTMRLNCNRATGSWKATPAADPSSGQFEFGPLAATRALCPPPYALVSVFPISRTPVIVAATTTNAWHDLFRLESGGGAEASHVRHVFDGTTCVERERVPVDRAPEGKRGLSGDVTFDKAVPLGPADKAAPGSGPVAHGDVRRHGSERHRVHDGRWHHPLPLGRQGLLLRLRPCGGGRATEDVAMSARQLRGQRRRGSATVHGSRSFGGGYRSRAGGRQVRIPELAAPPVLTRIPEHRPEGSFSPA